jgi:aminoglycoside phosphotransferase (APT) family kinase protein
VDQQAARHRTLQRAPSPAALDRVREVIAPGGRQTRVRRLRGGLDAGVHSVTFVMPDGERRSVVVRRYRERQVTRNPAIAARLWRILSIVEALGIPAPRPLMLDEDGSLFGQPAVVMSRLPGRGNLAPRDPARWTEQLAHTLAAIHRADTGAFDLGFLRGPSTSLDALIERDMGAGPPGGDPRRAAIRAALASWWPYLTLPAPTLTHGDYWAGNTLWSRGRLTGVVDWDWAALDYPAAEVGYCRMDLAMTIGGDVPDRFLAAYEDAAGRPVPDIDFWGLVAAYRAPFDPAIWLPGLHDLGRTDITAAMMRERWQRFTDDALRRAPAR